MIFLCHYSVLPRRSNTIKIEAATSCEAIAKLMALPGLAKEMEENGTGALCCSAFPEEFAKRTVKPYTDGGKFGVAMSFRVNDPVDKEGARKA